jgi:hypothetical protein
MLVAIPIHPKTLEVSFGEFVCPACKVKTAYKHKEKVKRLLLFFLVPIQGGTISEYVECQQCGERFPLGVLRGKIAPDAEQMLAALQQKLLEGTAIQEAESQLLEAGFEKVMVKRYVSVAAGINLKKCVRCELTFRGDVLKCHKCGLALPGGANAIQRTGNHG